MGFLSRFVTAWAACALGAACSSVDIEPFAHTPEPPPEPFSIVVEGVGFADFDGARISVRFPELEQERTTFIEFGRFAVRYEVPEPPMLPDVVGIEYVIDEPPQGPLHELCGADHWPVLRAEAPLFFHEGFATVVINHFEVPPEPIACEPHERP